MTAFVLDASVTAAWLLPDEANEHTRRLYALMRRDEVEPQAPNLWQWECANIIANGVRRGRIPQAAVEGLWSVLEAVRHRVELHEMAPPQHKASLAIAMDSGLSSYDAGYLWLARSLNLPLATFDRKLADAATQSGIRLLDLSTL
ncbi:Predicted nucleic acid-binding protein, contains PIN domain [Variovorax sp. HW608]|uniref:type II toxin-antitoxin system VapC family toxin n=1 Tax=Variovorax sp. HW608 TaxID=1034889 RepID=UPI00081FE6BE|nr:type II toxin-antitoxin system VapC family toxin [Variovorax sp. HW608]SCK55070.1 Predicted nucleic acid-binding protein, contains PIN domain [Variovorax sp. HW608]